MVLEFAVAGIGPDGRVVVGHFLKGDTAAVREYAKVLIGQDKFRFYDGAKIFGVASGPADQASAKAWGRSPSSSTYAVGAIDGNEAAGLMGADPIAVVKGHDATDIQKPVDIEKIHHSLVEGVGAIDEGEIDFDAFVD